MTLLTLIVVTLTVLAAVGAARLLARGWAQSRAWNATIASHMAATGDFPTVADWRAGRIVGPEDTPELDPTDPDPHTEDAGPVTVTVTVVDEHARALPGDAR